MRRSSIAPSRQDSGGAGGLDIRTEIYLNQLAQGIVPMDKGAWWFRHQDDDHQTDALRALASFATLAGATGLIAEAALARSGLRLTSAPAVLLGKAAKMNPLGSGGVAVALAKIIALPPDERPTSFTLLVTLLMEADERRRRRCARRGCRHWWHRDLSDPAVVDRIVAERG